MQRAAITVTLGKVIQTPAGTPVVRGHAVEVLRVASVAEAGQKRGDRILDGADESDLDRDPATDVLPPDIDLDDPGVLGKEGPVREIRTEHQQGVAVLHRPVAGRIPEQPGHPDVVRVVVLHPLLAAQGMHDRSLEPSANAISSSWAP